MEREQFFHKMAAEGLALTFDDVRLRTARSWVPAAKVDITSRFSRRVHLKAPLVSAAMDTITTSDMAIAMAKLGGIGVIHAGLTKEEQRNEVRRVKLHLNGRIEKPITINGYDSVESVLAMCLERGFDFRTFPVTDSDGVMIGLLTQNDFDFCSDTARAVREVMTPMHEIKAASEDTTVRQAYAIMDSHKKKTLPLIDDAGQVTGLYVLSDVLRIIRGNPDDYNLDASGHLRVAAAVPTDDEAIERVSYMGEYLDVAVIDSAQGDSQYALETLAKLLKLRDERFPHIDIVVGNISEAASAKALAEMGSDGIKVGQGPGSICTTRVETGIGCPQVTAVYECVEAIKEYDIPVCADGGIKDAGDISIAIAAGAESVMMGNKLAGTKETPGKVIMLEDKMVKLYRGMGSPSAMRDSEASRKRYGATGSKPLAEGVESYVPYQGPLSDVINHYVLALRKSMSYVGSADIKAHRTKTSFWRITNSGIRESRPHDVAVVSSTDNTPKLA